MTAKQVELAGGLALNAISAIPYIWILRSGFRLWLVLPLLAWGFLCFRWISQHLFGSSFMNVPVGLSTFFIVYAIGSLICAILGFVIIPILVTWQIIRFAMESKVT